MVVVVEVVVIIVVVALAVMTVIKDMKSPLIVSQPAQKKSLTIVIFHNVTVTEIGSFREKVATYK